jgi:hypothetical protein
MKTDVRVERVGTRLAAVSEDRYEPVAVFEGVRAVVLRAPK